MPDIHPPQGYRERPSRLAGAVVWARDGAVDTVTPVLPDGCMDLLWIDGRLSIAGPDTRAHHPTAGSSSRIAGIRFTPGAAPALLGIPAHELRDTRVALADVWSPAAVRHAAEILTQVATPAVGLEAIALWRAASADPADPLLAHLVTALRSGTSVAAIADTLEVGPRRLHRLSLAAFGYGPKTLSRILRMQRALALARAGVPLADTAARVGYADQAHLSREVREFADLSLTQLLRG
ncbi:helix-turn-helix domain-containing protein [Nocardia sp. 2]|uniref:Helix-turn-helix domain-containing protein n=1 Tax=Nocardia acididurans TaxID=2802282 RepID=A0ABS1M967_9NOCA|nr:helix-turn-helix domain-containing protein [Nocardia acididurans]MBL1077192.1 helix-turn-helix domain-containing protein [Nocardia acididurans]